jgi:hypothetical protein
MARKRVFLSTVVSGWERFLTALAANLNDFSHLEEHRGQLQLLLERARALTVEHNLHTAAKQDAARQLAEVLAEGSKLATFLRNAVKVRYGNRNDKLLEFGVPPLRRRRRSLEPQEKPTPTAAPTL